MNSGMEARAEAAGQAVGQALGHVVLGVGVPVMTQERFADLVGIDLGVLQNWVNRGYLPTIKIGRHRLINLVVLARECSEIEG